MVHVITALNLSFVSCLLSCIRNKCFSMRINGIADEMLVILSFQKDVVCH